MADAKKFLQAARQAMEEQNYEDAKKFYDMVKVEDPTNAEAKIQFQYCKFLDCTNGQAYNCYTDYMNILQSAVKNIAASDMSVEEQIAFLSTVIDNSFNAMKSCISAMDRIRVEGDSTLSKQQRMRKESILFARDFGDAVAQQYKDSAEGMKVACAAWKSYVNRGNGSIYISKQEAEILPTYVEKIQKIDPSFNFVPKKRGCF